MTTIRVEVSPSDLRCAPGEQQTLQVHVRNVSKVVAHYETLILGLPEGMTSSAVPVTKLRPGERAAVTATVSATSTPVPRAGEYVLGVLVRSTHGDGSSSCEEVRLTVPVIDEVVLRAEPALLNGGALERFRVTVDNRGNAPARVRFSGRDQEGRAALAFDPEWVDVEAQGHQTSQVTVRAPTPWTGQPKRRDVEVVGASDALAGRPPGESRASVMFVQRAKLAPAALSSARGLVTLGTGVATVLGGALLVRGTVQANTAASPPVSSPTGTSPPTSSGASSPSGSGSSSPVTTPAPPVELWNTAGTISTGSGDQAVLETDYRGAGISAIRGYTEGGVISPTCSAATGAAVFDAGSAGSGYIHAAIPEGDPSQCADVPLQVSFSPQPGGLRIFLPAAAQGHYALEVHRTDNSTVTLEADTSEVPPGSPAFDVQPTPGVSIDDVILSFVQGVPPSDGTTPPPTIIGISSLQVTPAGS